MFVNTILSRLGRNLPFALKRKKTTKHLVFFHIPRTGGSSIWHALAEIASLHQIPVIDLYHDALVKFSNSSKTVEAVSDIQKYLRKRPCLIHHHTDIKIQNYFDDPPNYATIVRDPFDRFLSDIIHLSTHLRSNPDTRAVVGGDEEITRVISDASIDINEVIYICSRSDYYQNYFRNWFGKLLLGRNGYGGDEQIKDIYDPRFPAHVRDTFQNISCFTNLNKALSDIVTAFRFPQYQKSLGFINKTSKGNVLENIRYNFVSHFEKDYAFLAEIGFSYKK